MPAISRSKRKGLLAAPIVVTAIFGPGCEGRVYRNPGPPEQPTTSATDTTTDPTGTPTATATATTSATATAATSQPVATTTASASAPSAVASLPPAPKGVPGTLRRLQDGTCQFEFPEPSMHCPPNTRCNPGPPMEPIKVKCPDGKGR